MKATRKKNEYSILQNWYSIASNRWLKITIISAPTWRCTVRKWHIPMAVMRGNRVGGNWLMKWDELKKFRCYTHRLMHRKRVTSELHDSYFRSMTITKAIPKIAEVTHPDRQISEEIAEAWRRVHISAWGFEGNIRPTNWTEASWVGVPVVVAVELESERDEMW